jgi:hypothetical protein
MQEMDLQKVDYLQRAGNILYIRSCWNDGCAAANRQQDSIQAE